MFKRIIGTTLFIAGLFFFVRFGSIAAPALGQITWGRSNSGLMCGLQVYNPPHPPMAQEIMLTIKNVGTAPVLMLPSDYEKLTTAFSVASENGSTVATSNTKLGDTGLNRVGGPIGTKVAPGEEDGRPYFIAFPDNAPSGTYSLALAGKVHGIQLSCGPVTFSL